MTSEAVVEQLLDDGQAASDAGDECTAERLFAQAAELGSANGRYNQGNALSRLGRLAEAVEAYRLAMDAGVDDAALNLGLTLEELGDRQGAEVAYRKAVEVGDPRGRAVLGTLLWNSGHRDAGEAMLRAAAADGDAHAAAEFTRFLDVLESLEGVEEIVRLAGSVDQDARTDLGRFLRRTGRSQEAARVLRNEATAGNTDAMIALALVLEEDLDDWDGAEAVLREAIEKGEVHAYNNLGLLMERRGEYVEAVRLLADGAEAGDPVAERNHRMARSQYKRQLNRHWRKKLRAERQAQSETP